MSEKQNAAALTGTSATTGSKLLRAWDDAKLQWHTYGNYFDEWTERNFMRASFNNLIIGQYARQEEDQPFRVYFGNTVFFDEAETADEAESMITRKFLEWIETLAVFPSNVKGDFRWKETLPKSTGVFTVKSTCWLGYFFDLV